MSLDGDTVKKGRVCLAIEKVQLDMGLSKYMSRRAARGEKDSYLWKFDSTVD